MYNTVCSGVIQNYFSLNTNGHGLQRIIIMLASTFSVVRLKSTFCAYAYIRT